MTKVGNFGSFVAGTLPSEFVAAMSSALPAVKSLDFSKLLPNLEEYTAFMQGDIPNYFWSEFPQLESVNFGNLRVPNSGHSKDGPNKMGHLQLQ